MEPMTTMTKDEIQNATFQELRERLDLLVRALLYGADHCPCRPTSYVRNRGRLLPENVR